MYGTVGVAVSDRILGVATATERPFSEIRYGTGTTRGERKYVYRILFWFLHLRAYFRIVDTRDSRYGETSTFVVFFFAPMSCSRWEIVARTCTHLADIRIRSSVVLITTDGLVENAVEQ
jgi:hypothetical protein